MSHGATNKAALRRVRAGAPAPDTGYHAAVDSTTAPFNCAGGIKRDRAEPDRIPRCMAICIALPFSIAGVVLVLRLFVHLTR